MEAKDVRTLMEAYASVYEGYGKKKKGDCISKSEKGDHNCAKKVCHEQYGEGECIFGQHAVPDENGFVSHYDVQFEHGIVENVSVEDLEILISESHPKEGHRYEGETISEMGGMLKKVAKIGAAAAGAAAAGKALEKATSSKEPTRDEKDAADAKKHLDNYRKKEKMKEELSIDEGIMGALKRVGKAVLGPADQSPKAEAERMGKRRGPKMAPKAGSKPAMRSEDADLFDIVKGHLMDEGLSEKEALEKMLTLTDEERTEMVEGSCMGGKDKKKKRK